MKNQNLRWSCLSKKVEAPSRRDITRAGGMFLEVFVVFPVVPHPVKFRGVSRFSFVQADLCWKPFRRVTPVHLT